MIKLGIKEQAQKSLSELLQIDEQYRVPIFQREYSWKKDDWIDLLDDIEKAKNSGKQHFFGFMMFMLGDDNKINVIEGQQRLATSILILCLIRDILYSLDNNLHSLIEKKYLIMDNMFKQNEPKKYKLSLAKLNIRIFENYILKLDYPSSKISKFRSERKLHKSNKLILQAYKFFNEHFKNKLKDLPLKEQIKYCSDFSETALKNLIVITTEVTDNKTAYNIFQTLNDRGLDLALADLLKVHLFEIAGDRIDEAKIKWDEITNSLGNINLNIFLRHYWVSKYAIVSQKHLMDEFEKNIIDIAQVFDFLDNLRNEAEMYETIYNLSTDYWDSNTVKLIEELFILSKNIVLPLLLGALPKLDKRLHKKFLRICISFIFRYLTIAERENKELESKFSKLSKDIRSGKVKTGRAIRDVFIKIHVDNETFISIFKNKDIKTAKVARYILQKIEHSYEPLQEKFSDKITLEHILPKTPNDEWKEYIRKEKIDKDDVVDKIGNMTLLLAPVNKKAQNSFYPKKRDLFYKKMSSLRINKDLANIKSWNESDILKRQSEFAKRAVDIWKI
ncbi:MAG: DUF262 domain-containing protein [Candidatus Cloacimonetes bacterium]|nr:DUF262 domain-containing protein [Candidatus Cloacimonadota bacterium]